MSFFNTGPTGPTGPPGLINLGPQGPRGPTGPTTFQSPSNVTGATGSPGATGITGPPSSGGNGPTGRQGATGPPSSAQTGPTGAGIPAVSQFVFSSDLKAGNQVIATANSNVSVLNGRLVIVNCGSLQWTSLGPQPSGALTITMPFSVKAGGQTGMGNVGKVSGIFVPVANQSPVIFASISNNNNYVSLYYWNNSGVQTPLDGSMINTAAGEVTLSIRYPI